MTAIPQIYPVVVELPESADAVLLEGVLSDLVQVDESSIVEGHGRMTLSVAARDEATAARRAAAATGGQVLEVHEPTPLQKFARAGALPYGRSRVFGRYKAGRFNVQGGAGNHQPAAPPAPPSGAVQSAMASESVDFLLGPPLTEATAAQRKKRELRRKQFRQKNPERSRKLSRLAKRTSRKRATRRAARQKQITRRAARYKDRYDPNYESLTVPSQTLDHLLSGYPYATRVHEKLRSIPESWFHSERGRSSVLSAIREVRSREGHTPADALESAYVLDTRIPPKPLAEEPRRQTVAAQSLHEVRVRFASERERNFAVRNVHRYTESCRCARPDGETEATFEMCACHSQQAGSFVAESLRQMNIRRFQHESADQPVL